MVLIARYINTSNIAQRRESNTLNINSLMGVDYSSSNINISDNHAVEINNLLKIDNVLQKRSGWQQIMSIENGSITQVDDDGGPVDIELSDGAKINGLWMARYNGNNKVIAHIGTKFYFVNNIETFNFEKIYLKEIATPEDVTIKNEKSWGVVANDRLYILCGSYIVIKLETEEMSRVYDDVDTYIPTTTIGITPSEIPTDISRTSYDDLNLLSPYRYNTMLSLESTDSELEKYTYMLDSPMEYETYAGGDKLIGDFEITINYLNDDNEAEKIEITIENGTSCTAGHVWNLTSGGQDIGYLSITQDENHTASVVLKKYYKPLIEGKDNIVVKFKDKRTNESGLIENCRFGVLYGANNNRNRLFVTGNPNTPNTDYHTSQRNIYANDNDVDLLENKDFTYFSVKDYCNYGTTNSKVMGYQIMGDGTLLVMKEKIDNEPTVYFRRGTYESFNTYVGEDSITLQRETYPMYVGNIGEGLVVENGLFNLNNDIVFLSKNGLFGISSGITASSLNSDYRYAYSRSRLINRKLTNYDLSNAKLVMYDNKLFITIKDTEQDKYVTYVADGRYRTKLNDSIDNEYEYEWFVLDNVDAENYFVINNRLYFSNEKGLFYWNLYSRNYQDAEFAVTANVGTFSFDTDGLTINDEFVEKNINENTKIRFNNSLKVIVFKIDLSRTMQDVNYDRNGYYICNSNEITNKFFADTEGLVLHYFINQEGTCYLKKNGNRIKFTSRLDNDENILKNVDSSWVDSKHKAVVFYTTVEPKVTYDYRLVKNGDKYNVIGNNDEVLQFYGSANVDTDYYSGSIYTRTYHPIKAYYLTKSFNFGQSINTKVLRTLSITNDTDLYSKVNLAILTEDAVINSDTNTFIKNVYQLDVKDQYSSATKGITDLYENIFKADLTSRTFRSSFTKDFLLKFNYIQFAFYNEDEENCVINNLAVVYTFGFKKKGV